MGACESPVTERENNNEIPPYVKLSGFFHTQTETCFKVNAVLSGLLSAPLCALSPYTNQLPSFHGSGPTDSVLNHTVHQIL